GVSDKRAAVAVNDIVSVAVPRPPADHVGWWRDAGRPFSLHCITHRQGRVRISELIANRRADGDNHTREEQRHRGAAENVSADFVFRFHSYTSVLRREPWSRLALRGEGQVEL